ncbi:MAG TPA: hypothetical protein VK973_16470, partial [Arenicellales bacterium]|nr:hypothetical protein [Arenicellales bacterium]
LALLRGGTTNMIHGDVGWPGRPDAALESLLTCLREERVARRERHVLRVRPEGSDTAHHGFFFGTHAIVRAIVRTRARFHQRGMRGTVSELLSATALVWRLLRRNIDRDPVLAPISLELRRGDGAWRRTSHILLMATSLRRLILGARPLAAGQRAGLAELSGPDYRLLPWLWRLFRGRIEALETLSLRGDVEWILDGEIHRHHAADGALTVEPAEPAAFLVRRSRS